MSLGAYTAANVSPWTQSSTFHMVESNRRDRARDALALATGATTLPVLSLGARRERSARRTDAISPLTAISHHIIFGRALSALVADPWRQILASCEEFLRSTVLASLAFPGADEGRAASFPPKIGITVLTPRTHAGRERRIWAAAPVSKVAGLALVTFDDMPSFQREISRATVYPVEARLRPPARHATTLLAKTTPFAEEPDLAEWQVRARGSNCVFSCRACLDLVLCFIAYGARTA